MNINNTAYILFDDVRLLSSHCFASYFDGLLMSWIFHKTDHRDTLHSTTLMEAKAQCFTFYDIRMKFLLLLFLLSLAIVRVVRDVESNGGRPLVVPARLL